MATLHVKNVPDALYEDLRCWAKKRHRSIAAEVLVLWTASPGVPFRSTEEMQLEDRSR
jgi:plasmid stability protein